MAERLKAHAWKACLGETLTGVRIPLSPPDFDVVFSISYLVDYFELPKEGDSNLARLKSRNTTG